MLQTSHDLRLSYQETASICRKGTAKSKNQYLHTTQVWNPNWDKFLGSQPVLKRTHCNYRVGQCRSEASKKGMDVADEMSLQVFSAESASGTRCQRSSQISEPEKTQLPRKGSNLSWKGFCSRDAMSSPWLGPKGLQDLHVRQVNMC